MPMRQAKATADGLAMFAFLVAATILVVLLLRFAADVARGLITDPTGFLLVISQLALLGVVWRLLAARRRAA